MRKFKMSSTDNIMNQQYNQECSEEECSEEQIDEYDEDYSEDTELDASRYIQDCLSGYRMYNQNRIKFYVNNSIIKLNKPYPYMTATMMDLFIKNSKKQTILETYAVNMCMYNFEFISNEIEYLVQKGGILTDRAISHIALSLLRLTIYSQDPTTENLLDKLKFLEKISPNLAEKKFQPIEYLFTVLNEYVEEKRFETVTEAFGQWLKMYAKIE